MNKSTIPSVIVASMLTVACGKKSKSVEPHFHADQLSVKQTEEDSATAHVREDAQPSEDKTSAPTRSNTPSASRSNESVHNGNMRGFDPVLEDDMEDNGMSRYMENNEDEGWD